MAMTRMDAYFGVGYFRKKVGCGSFSAPSAKRGVTVTALGIQRMLILCKACALMVKNMSGRCIMQNITD
jgi:hypothetical protein